MSAHPERISQLLADLGPDGGVVIDCSWSSTDHLDLSILDVATWLVGSPDHRPEYRELVAAEEDGTKSLPDGVGLEIAHFLVTEAVDAIDEALGPDWCAWIEDNSLYVRPVRSDQ